MQKICTICKKYIKQNCKKCKQYANICTICKNMQKYVNNVQNMQEICKKYARNMQEICPKCKKYAKYAGRQHKSLWLSNNNENKNKGFQGSLCHAVCVAGGAGFDVCWVNSTCYRWDLPLHASRVAFRVLSSIVGENASAATIW